MMYLSNLFLNWRTIWPTSLNLDEQVLLKAVVSRDCADSPLVYYRLGVSLLARYCTHICNLLRHPHMRAAIGMGGTTAIIARHFGESKLVGEFMDGLLILIRQHLKRDTNTEDTDLRGLIWDHVSPREVSILHGYMSTPKEEDFWILVTDRILTADMPKEWNGSMKGYIHGVFHSILSDMDKGKITMHTRDKWCQFLHSRFNLYLKNNQKAHELEARGGPESVYLLTCNDYNYGKELGKITFAATWNKTRICSLDILAGLRVQD